MSESARARIISEGGFSKIEHYMFEDHVHISRAAVQCMCNMTQSDAVIKMFEGDNDRVSKLINSDVVGKAKGKFKKKLVGVRIYEVEIENKNNKSSKRNIIYIKLY